MEVIMKTKTNNLLAILIMLLLSASLVADEVGDLQQSVAQLEAEVDALKRAQAEQQPQGMEQKEQWGQGNALEIGVILGNAFSGNIGSLEWMFPKIKNALAFKLGLEVGLSVDESDANVLSMSALFNGTFGIELYSPLMFNFTRTYSGVSLNVGAEASGLMNSEQAVRQFDAILGGINKIYTGMELYGLPYMSFFFELGVDRALSVRYDIGSNHTAVQFLGTSYGAMGLRYYSK